MPYNSSTPKKPGFIPSPDDSGINIRLDEVSTNISDSEMEKLSPGACEDINIEMGNNINILILWILSVINCLLCLDSLENVDDCQPLGIACGWMYKESTSLEVSKKYYPVRH